MYGKPIVLADVGGFQQPLHSYDCLRLADPDRRVGPMWDRLPQRGIITVAEAHHRHTFGALLNERIPPGPKYSELITEIWHRGYEVFLVGGTVRDVLSGIESHDVDIVTSMPLIKALPLFRDMYRSYPKPSLKDGFIRLGGDPEIPGSFIDLKVFCTFQPGQSSAIFGAAFAEDLDHRDFACNSVYYDPVNSIFIDPSGDGISEAKSRTLSLVFNRGIQHPFRHAKVVVRFFKFHSKGFSCSAATVNEIRSNYIPALPSMKRSDLEEYTYTQLLSKLPKTAHQATLEAFRRSMVTLGFTITWDKFFEPIKGDLLS